MKKILFLISGHLCLILGIIGAFLPLLPTTPFLLLAAFCYSKSNPAVHQWLLNHKYLGTPLNDWEKSGVISLKAKILATVMIGLIIIFRLPYLKIEFFIRVTAITILIMVLIFIWSRPSKPKELTKII